MIAFIRVIILTMPQFLGIMRMFSPRFPSSSTNIGLTTITTITIAIILLASPVTIVTAQQQEQHLTSQPSAIGNGITTETAMSTEDSFRVQIPQGWVIQDKKNTGFALGAEVLQGYGILAQLCPEGEEEQRQGATPFTNASSNASDGSTNSNSSCQGAQEEMIHILRFPNLGARLGLSSDDNTIGNVDVTADTILAYQMQKLQEAGYRDIRIVNSTDATINVDLGTGLNNNTNAATGPAKLVEMTYSTNLTPDETRRGYFISTATDITPPNLGTIKGYAVFYEGNSTKPTAAEITTASGSLTPLPPTVGQVFDSFELIVAPEVAQAIAQEAAEDESLPVTDATDTNATDTNATEIITEAAETAEDTGDGDDNGGDGDDNGGDGDDNGGDGDDNGGDGDDNGGDGDGDDVTNTPDTDAGDGDDNGGDGDGADTACDSSYPDDCISSPPPDLDCGDDGIPENFEVLQPDPHEFDADNDGIGCESESNEQPDLDEEPDSLSSDFSPGIGGIISWAIDVFAKL
jgi:hypothetical protein